MDYAICKGSNRNQATLFPESIEDYITSDNQVRVIDAYVEQLDMVALNFNFAIYPDVGRPYNLVDYRFPNMNRG